MAFCANCGAEVQGRYCAKCGTPLNVTGSEGTGASAGPPPGAQPYTQPSAQAGGLTDNVAGALCYAVGLFTGILFLVLAPYSQNKFVRFHAFQSIFLHLAWIVFWMADTIITMMLPFSMMIINSLLWMVIFLGGLAVWVFCIVKAYNNERFKLPIIGDLAEKQA
jgi:uncharacterized membrane protein